MVETTTWIFKENYHPKDVIEAALSKNFRVASDLKHGVWHLVATGEQTADLYSGLSPAVRANITCVLGLNQVGQLRNRITYKAALDAHNASYYTPIQVASYYNFPSSSANSPLNTPLNADLKVVGIIELGGGYTKDVITSYLASLGYTGDISLTDVPIMGATNNPADVDASSEVLLDIEVILAIVPTAPVRVYFAPNTDQGFYNAISTAILDKCKIISISWGGPESSWSPDTMTAFDNLFKNAEASGSIVFAASGDNGSSDGGSRVDNVDFPASSPHVIGCGGTTLSVSGEIAWSSGGGGYSGQFFTTNAIGSSSGGSSGKRGVPDVAGNADPASGYLIYDLDKNETVVGGTSAVAPLWSALFSMINFNGKNVKDLLYKNQQVFNDILIGSNGDFSAKKGWDPCTGLGSPNGKKVQALFTPTFSVSVHKNRGVMPFNCAITISGLGLKNIDFGDGTPPTLAAEGTFHHVYNKIGTFTISVEDSLYVDKQEVSVYDMVVDFSFAVRGKGVVCTNRTNVDGSFLWTFGDGGHANGKNASHNYGRNGLYLVTLTIIKDEVSKSISKHVRI